MALYQKPATYYHLIHTCVQIIYTCRNDVEFHYSKRQKSVIVNSTELLNGYNEEKVVTKFIKNILKNVCSSNYRTFAFLRCILVLAFDHCSFFVLFLFVSFFWLFVLFCFVKRGFIYLFYTLYTNFKLIKEWY